MSVSNKKPEDLYPIVESSMRWESGEEVVAKLDWDECRFYLWFEPSYSFECFCEEIGREDLLVGLKNNLAQIGVKIFFDLEDVNEYCKDKCGSDDPYDCARFYKDEWGDICGTY